MKAKLMIIGPLFFFMGCSKSVLIPATYVEKHDKNVASFVSEEYKFGGEHKFEYKFLSDDLQSSKYGVGNFRIKNHRLLLEFTNEPLGRPKSALISKESLIADSSKNFYRVHVKTYSGTNLPGAIIIITSLTNDTIAGSATDMNGTAEIALSREINPYLLKVSFLGYEDMILKLNRSENLNLEVMLAEKVYGTQIDNKRMEKRIRIQDNSVIIDGKEYQNITVDENE